MYLVIARGGDHLTGAVYKFETLDEAELHPVVQYYDLILSKPEHLRDFYKPEQLEELFTRFSGAQHHGSRADLPERTLQVLMEHAEAPPSDPKSMIGVIAEDRKAVGGFNRNNYKREEGDEAMAAKAAKKSAKKAAKKKGAPPVRKSRLKPDQKITVVANENPKREGSAAHKAFAKYKTGMTVESALKAGVKSSDLNWDIKHGHIKVA